MTPRQASKALGQITGKIDRNLLAATKKATKRAKAIAVQESSGTHSTAELARLRRQRGAGVYSVANPDGRFDPGKVNAQTGDFREGWRDLPPHFGADGALHGTLINASSKAKYFDGQPHGAMRARPIADKVAARVQAIFLDAVSAAVRRSLS